MGGGGREEGGREGGRERLEGRVKEKGRNLVEGLSLLCTTAYSYHYHHHHRHHHHRHHHHPSSIIFMKVTLHYT